LAFCVGRGLTHFDRRRKAFLRWKNDFVQVYAKFIPEPLPRSVETVKVGVLDTGIDLNHPRIGVHKHKISGLYRLKEPWYIDLIGHGTHVAGLILDLIPDSELYVVKVTDDEKVSPENMARVSGALGSTESSFPHP
jgi:subtilisin family serine protease